MSITYLSLQNLFWNHQVGVSLKRGPWEEISDTAKKIFFFVINKQRIY